MSNEAIPEAAEQQLLQQTTRHSPEWWLRAIAVLEVAGGVFGLFAVTGGRSTSSGIFLLLGSVLFIFSIVAGVLLWRGGDRGLKLSAIVQALQIVNLSSPLFTYAFGAGLSVTISLAHVPDDILIGFRYGTIGMYLLYFGPLPQNQPAPFLGPPIDYYFGVNLLAFVLCICLVYRTWESSGHQDRRSSPPSGEGMPELGSDG